MLVVVHFLRVQLVVLPTARSHHFSELRRGFGNGINVTSLVKRSRYLGSDRHSPPCTCVYHFAAYNSGLFEYKRQMIGSARRLWSDARLFDEPFYLTQFHHAASVGVSDFAHADWLKRSVSQTCCYWLIASVIYRCVPAISFLLDIM